LVEEKFTRLRIELEARLMRSGSTAEKDYGTKKTKGTIE
jgi:hypothetical protein